jgi:hypothetical protein
MRKHYVEFLTERPKDVNVNGKDATEVRRALKRLSGELTKLLEAVTEG